MFTIAANSPTGQQFIGVKTAGGTTLPLPFVVGTDFMISENSPSSTGAPGATAMTTLTLTPTTINTTFPVAVTFNVTGLPAETTCQLNGSPCATYSLPASDGVAASTNVTLVMTTTAPAILVAPRTPGPQSPLAAPGLAMLTWASLFLALGAALGTARKQRGIRLHWALGATLIIALVGLAGACSGGGTTTMLPPNPGTPAGTYPVMVTAASANASHSVTYTLMVQ